MPKMIRILCEGLATVLFALICTRYLCKNMKKRDFRFVPWLPYVLTGCGSAMLFLLGGLSPRTFCGIAFLFVLLYALGDFYEFFDEDAKRTAEICDLIMTTRAMADGTRHPMCGVPKYTIDRYEQKLKEAGYTVVFRDFNEFNADRQATPEPDKDIPTEEHIFLDSTREELYWIYYNPDSDAGGQLVTNTLSFSVFREAYEDFVSNGGDFTDKEQRDAFIDSIGEMADCELADQRGRKSGCHL